MELAIIGAFVIAALVLANRSTGDTTTPPQLPPTTGGGGDGQTTDTGLESYRNDLMANLRQRGWGGAVLPGATRDEIYQNYLAVIRQMEQDQQQQDLERIRNEFTSDLQHKGVNNAQLQGNTPAAIYASYLTAYLESLRGKYVAYLRARGWTGTWLSGANTDAVYQSYLAEVDKLNEQQRIADLDRIRAYYVGDLQRRGWSGLGLTGNSASAIYDNYLATYKTLLAEKYKLITPLGEPSQGGQGGSSGGGSGQVILHAKFNIGDRVRTTGGRVGVVAWYRYDIQGGLFQYRLEEYPYTWYDEPLLTAAVGAAV